MTAKEMFESLGWTYHCNKYNNKHIFYTKEFEFCTEYIEFINDGEQPIAFATEPDDFDFVLEIDELKAVNKQIEEILEKEGK